MKKLSISCLIFVLPLISYGQNANNYRKLITKGRIQELSVSPDEKLWIGTNLGKLYQAENFDSTWVVCDFPECPENEYATKPLIERISFFNSEQAIMTGRFRLQENGAWNGIHQTNDGGKTWSAIDFGGDMWVQNTFVEQSGKAWISGPSYKIFYSNDFGQTWNIRTFPQNDSIWISTLFMSDSINGILSTWYPMDNLYSTQDNWETAIQLETPQQQKKTKSKDKNPHILYFNEWNDCYIVQQGQEFFYSKKAEIDWTKINLDIVLLTIDKESNRIFCVLTSKNIVELIDIINPVANKIYNIKRQGKLTLFIFKKQT